MDIEIYGKQGCDLCTMAKEKFSSFIDRSEYKDSISLRFIDMSTSDGMTEGILGGISKIPTIIFKENSKVIAKWEEKVPAISTTPLYQYRG